MDAHRQGLVARCLLVWGAVTSFTLVLAGSCTAELMRPLSPGPATAEEVLVRGAAALALLCLPRVWWAVTSTCWQLGGGTLTRRPSGLLRRGVVLACGGALALGALAPAHAGTPEGRDASPRQLLHGLPMPERATLPAASPRPSSRDEAGQQTRHVVRSGESLWSIAADSLGPGSARSSIDSLWRRIHALNSEVIGEDPDLIRPGQSLRLPPATTPTRPSTDHHHQGDRS